MPRPQDRILVRLIGSFQNLLRAPPSFLYGSSLPRDILQLLHYANDILLNLPAVTSLPLSVRSSVTLLHKEKASNFEM